MCIGRATDENVQSDENVPIRGRKRPRFRATSTKMSYIPSKACQVQGRKRPKFQSLISKVRKRPTFQLARYENVPDPNRQGTKTSQIPFSTWEQKCPNFWDENVPFSNHDATKNILVFMRSSAIFGKICENMRWKQKYAELCGEYRIVRNCAENWKLCEIALTALKCCLWCNISYLLKLQMPASTIS